MINIKLVSSSCVSITTIFQAIGERKKDDIFRPFIGYQFFGCMVAIENGSAAKFQIQQVCTKFWNDRKSITLFVFNSMFFKIAKWLNFVTVHI